MALFDIFRKARSPSAKGVSGAAINMGFGETIYDSDFEIEERSEKLQGRKKYETYMNMLSNVTVIAASVRYFLNLTARTTWTLSPAKEDSKEAEEYAAKASEILFKDPKTSWHRVVRRLALYRFYGFSIQEFTVYRRDDGVISIFDIMNRPQSTIREWVFNPRTSELEMVVQEHPQTSELFRLPREQILYIVDDTISDSPSGLGLLRHIVAAADALKRYEQLEGIGFETDLRGIPIGRAPMSALAQMVKAGQITKEQMQKLLTPVKDFLKNHVKSARLSMLLDSHPYHAQDEAQRPSPQKQWDIELLKSTSTSLEPIARAIQRLNREIARVLGTEQLMLGEDIAGSFALSKDKTQSFIMLVEGALKEMKEVVKRDLLTPIWLLNGWPLEMMPEPTTESVNYKDIEEIARALQYLTLAGTPIHPDDPAVQVIREIANLPPMPQNIIDRLVKMIQSQADDERTNLNENIVPPTPGQ